MTTLQALKLGRRRIVGGWCRNSFTKKIGGRTCYCAVGAIKNRDGETHQGAYDALKSVCKPAGFSALDAVVTFNDDQKDKRPVLRLYDRAIAEELEKR